MLCANAYILYVLLRSNSIKFRNVSYIIILFKILCYPIGF
jgi:hypothetical protein